MMPVINVPYINVNHGLKAYESPNKVLSKKNVRVVTNQPKPIDRSLRYVCFLFLLCEIFTALCSL